MAVFFGLKAGDKVEHTFVTDEGGIDTYAGFVQAVEGVQVLVKFPKPLHAGQTRTTWVLRKDLSYIPPTYTHCQEPHCNTTFGTGSTSYHTGICWECLTNGLRISAAAVEHLAWEVEWRSRSDFEDTRETVPHYEKQLGEARERARYLVERNELAKRYR